MSRYFVRRILETIPLMLIISIFVFMFIHLIPGDPARSIAGLDAEEWEVSKEKLYRSLVVSNLIAIHQKYYIGSLSAYCGAVSAACGAGAGITYMYGGNYHQVSLTIINTLGNVGGIVCDGAKPSCAAKIASSVDAALMAFHLSIQNKSFLPGEGIIKGDVEETIKSMGYIGRVGMRATDTEILNVMIDRANINQDC